MNHITVEERHQHEQEVVGDFGGGAECLTETNADQLPLWLVTFFSLFTQLGGICE